MTPGFFRLFEATLRANTFIRQRNIDAQDLLLDEVAVYSMISACLRSMNRHDESFRVLTKAIALFPDRPDLEINLALLELDRRRHDVAAQALDRALRLAYRPEHAHVLLDAARLLEKGAQAQAAAVYVAKAASLLRDDSQA